MKKLLLALVMLGSAHSLFAKDSTWNLCQGKVVLFEEDTRLVVNVYEHRSPEGRATELTLIYGGSTLIGTLDSTENDSGNVLLKNDHGSTYEGQVAVDYQTNKISLAGTLTLNGAPSPLKTQMKCATLSN